MADGYHITSLPRNPIMNEKIYHNTNDQKVIKDTFSSPKGDSSGLVLTVMSCIADAIARISPKRNAGDNSINTYILKNNLGKR